MKSNVFTVAEVPGSKRTSHRIYTHAIIGQPDHRAVLKMWQQPGAGSSFANHWDYEKRNSECKPGEDYNRDGCHFPVKANEIERAKKFISENPDKEAFVAKGVKENIDFFTYEVAHDLEKPFSVLQWSQSYQNAAKAINEKMKRGNQNVRIVPVIQVK